MIAKPIRVIVTGGTFDKAYDAIKGELTFKESHLPEILGQIRVTVPVEIELNQLIDSLQMQDENRRSVLVACRHAPENCIIITHGTDTMAETARLIGPARLAKTIVITGAMVPFQVQGSDALFNFGDGLFRGPASTLWRTDVVMNGRIFDWEKVRKDKKAGIFEEA